MFEKLKKQYEEGYVTAETLKTWVKNQFIETRPGHYTGAIQRNYRPDV